MRYESTRGNSPVISSAEAIKLGIAPDGGLFVPTDKVFITPEELSSLADLPYDQRAVNILSKFLTDFTEEELKECVAAAYSAAKFDSQEVAPVHQLTSDLSVLELWHGPTCAFKDMALQILPQFLVRSIAKTGETAHIVILVATSGDTGKAALEGFADVPGTSIIVFFPQEGVSDVQRLQMVTQKGQNVEVLAVMGNFDDAQNGVKQVFGDSQTALQLEEKGYRLSSANSINWGRLVPQIIYYFSAYADLVKSGRVESGQAINFVVPTGNFGNILAGFYAKQMGLPVNKLICAANANNILTDFINTGTYDRNREFFKTNSPSMDILISSNLERLLYLLTDRNSQQINNWMNDLKTKGSYSIDDQTLALIKSHFWSGWCDDEETLVAIKKVWDNHSYLVDTHTAVALDVLEKYRQSTGDNTLAVVASTASPFKFNSSVARAVLGDEVVGKNEFELLNELSSYTGWAIPEGLKNLEKRTVLHQSVVERDQIGQSVKNLLI